MSIASIVIGKRGNGHGVRSAIIKDFIFRNKDVLSVAIRPRTKVKQPPTD
jgi:hypothetical protein